MEGSREGLPALLETVRACCHDSLRSERLSVVARATDALGLAHRDLLSLVNDIYYSTHRHEAVIALKNALTPFGVDGGDASVEQFLLLHTALASLDRIPGLPVSASVKHLICEEFLAFANPQPADIPMLQAGRASFTASCRVATLHRFPAGQIHWEMSGLPRSWLLKPDIARMPRLWRFALLKLRGLKPAFSSHLAWRRKNRLTITELEQKRSYYRMAQSLRFQPRTRGLVTDSWLYSPDTGRVSPHLAWLGEFFRENGGLVVVLGPAPEGSGYLEGSGARRRLYARGEYRPTTALVLWPRAAMLAWAEHNPELADEADSTDHRRRMRAAPGNGLQEGGAAIPEARR